MQIIPKDGELHAKLTQSDLKLIKNAQAFFAGLSQIDGLSGKISSLIEEFEISPELTVTLVPPKPDVPDEK